MTKIVLSLKKDVDAEQAEMLKLVIKKALADYFEAHVPVGKNISPDLKRKDPETWHLLMEAAEKHVNACMLLHKVRAADIEVSVTS
jgi:hypothetical protein